MNGWMPVDSALHWLLTLVESQCAEKATVLNADGYTLTWGIEIPWEGRDNGHIGAAGLAIVPSSIGILLLKLSKFSFFLAAKKPFASFHTAPSALWAWPLLPFKHANVAVIGLFRLDRSGEFASLQHWICAFFSQLLTILRFLAPTNFDAVVSVFFVNSSTVSYQIFPPPMALHHNWPWNTWMSRNICDVFK